MDPMDISAALRRARLCRSQPNGRWRVTGPDSSDEDLSLVVEVFEQVVVVTVFVGDEE
ncbi:MAG: hypothetical protein JST92_11770 [Deltaproteobacteria bacterium]|nr:hypothetical protein [Deltaproteobacteria bacterium]